MIEGAGAMRARTLLRRHVRATIALGLFAGVAGGAALGAWGIARRTSTAYDRFEQYQGATTYSLFTCPPDLEGFDVDACRTYDQADLVDFVRTVPGVRSAGRWSFAMAAVSTVEDPDTWAMMLVPFPLDTGALPALGTPILLDGRYADQRAGDEIVINEELAALAHVGVGDQLLFTVAAADEFDMAVEGLERPRGEPMTMDIVGIVRRPADLTVRPFDDTLVDNLVRAEATQAWAERVADDFAGFGIGVAVHSDTLTADDVLAAVRSHWPGRPIDAEVVQPAISRSPDAAIDAIRLQAMATGLVAIVIGLAALVFAGQAVARQTRREWADADVLGALGMTRGTMVGAAAIRGAATAVAATGVALATMIASSALGPVGVARKAEPHPGVDIDLLVLAIGLPAVALSVLAFAVVPVAMHHRNSARSETRTKVASGLPARLPPTFDAGWAMTRSRRAGGLAIGSAIAGVALAAGTGIAAWGLTTSYDDLVATPDRYGAEWDALVGNAATPDQQADVEHRLEAIPGITAVQILSLSGQEPQPEFTILAAEPAVGEKSFGVVTRGRPPITSDEAAVGLDTMRELGLGIGDSITLPPDDPTLQRPFEIVGEAIINDGFEARPGIGALVTPDAFTTVAPDGDGSTFAVWVDDGFDRATTLAAVRQAFPTTYVEPRPTDKIANLKLVGGQPKVLTLVVGCLAGAALVHALVMSVRRSRRQIGVLKTLGFTRRQVVASISWHASTIAAIALIAGVPLGIVAGRVTWTAISTSLGVQAHHALPLGAIAVVAVVVLLIANVAALAPGIAAARTRPARTLRAE